MAHNARFWLFLENNSVAKLTLRPGQTLTHHGGGPTDEGYHWWSMSFTHEGDYVTRRFDSESRDCDGRATHFSEYHCPLDALKGQLIQRHEPRAPYSPLPRKLEHYPMPVWAEDEYLDRDLTAEAAGY